MNITLLYVIYLIINLTKATISSLDDGIITQINKNEKILSRKKRYLSFPDGSSLQLVFCLTMPSLGRGNNVFTVGSTAALAWELPHDPLQFFRKQTKSSKRIDKIDEKNKLKWVLKNSNSNYKIADYTINNYDPFANKPSFINYRTTNILVDRPVGPFVNNFSQYSLNNQNEQTNYYSPVQISRPANNKIFYNVNPNIYNDENLQYSHPIYHHVYRRTRRDLYPKIEKLFTALKKDGKACLLKSICEVSKLTKERGTFLEEIFKVLFRVKQHENHKNEDEYDNAANLQHNCTQMYPTCSFTFNKIF